MKILCVFCVVLYFQRGGCLYPPINGNYQNQRSEQYNDQRNLGINYNRPHNFHNNPSEINYQNEPQTLIEQQLSPVKTINEPYLRQENSPPQMKTEIQEINKTPSRESGVLKKQVVLSEYLGAPPNRKLNKETFQPETDIKPIISLTGRVNQPPLKSNEEITLELEGVSPEYIQTLIGEQGPRANKQNPPLINHQNILDIKNHKQPSPSQTLQQPDQYPTASFQNPSAESVYELKQALPYRINTQHFSNTPNENIYVKNIINNSRRIQDIYKSERPVKRYTIIHPDGRIEQIDQIEGLFEKHPNYILVKSDDIMKHVQGRPIPFSKPQTPVERTPTIKPITINKQPNIEQNRGNSIPDNKTSITLPVVTNPILTKERTLQLPKLNETQFKETIINKTSDATGSDPITIPQKQTSPSTHHEIISSSSVSAVTETIQKSPTSVNNTEIIETTVKNSQQNQVRNNTELKKSGIENQNVIGPNVLLNSSNTAVRPVSSDKNFSEFLINTKPTPILNESTTLTSVQDSKINSNDTSPSEMNKESLDLETASPSTVLSNNTGNSSFWFKADDDFWNKLISGNNTQNLIYFLFVPPKTNPEKETKTTIYPNGTTVEEVIERINGDDGEPKITKSTTVTHKNSTEDVQS